MKTALVVLVLTLSALTVAGECMCVHQNCDVYAFLPWIVNASNWNINEVVGKCNSPNAENDARNVML